MTEEERKILLAVIARQNKHLKVLSEMNLRLQREILDIQEDKRLLRSLFPLADIEATQAEYSEEEG